MSLGTKPPSEQSKPPLDSVESSISHTQPAPLPSEKGRSLLQRAIEAIHRLFQVVKPKQKIETALIGALITAFATLTIAIVNLVNGLNEQLERPFQIQDSLTKTQITVDQHRQSVLSDYFGMVTELLVTNQSHSKEEFAVLRALTHATLQELDASRKRYVMLFLHDANLIQQGTAATGLSPEPFLARANLVGANLQAIPLHDADLRQTDLRGADLRAVDLTHANFQDADLSGADLRAADLRDAIFQNTNLTNVCYNQRTRFDPNFDPVQVGMKEVAQDALCSPSVSSPLPPVQVSSLPSYRRRYRG
jgi:uncharacterized protein YjbI with pentapeptide repeats